MGGQQVKISQRLNSCLTLGGIAHRMVKHAAIIIHPGLIAICVHLCLSQDRSIPCHDFPPYDPVGKPVQARIIGIINHVLASHLKEIPHVHGQSQEQGHHQVGNAQDAAIRLWIRSCFPWRVLFIRHHPVPPRHFSLIYTAPV